MAKILLVEDDTELARSLIDWLELEHHNVEYCERGNDALERLKFFEFDVVILDWNLPEVTGIEILKEFRDRGGMTPILLLTGRDGVAEIETGLNAGADDYLTKPCNVRELSARVKALMRRQNKVYEQVFKIRGLEVDIPKHRVSRDGKEIKLQPKEFSLLEFLLRNPNDAFSVESLLSRIWSSDSDASPDTVRVCITRLRNKIDVADQPSIIRTVHRIGYQIDLFGNPPAASS